MLINRFKQGMGDLLKFKWNRAIVNYYPNTFHISYLDDNVKDH